MNQKRRTLLVDAAKRWQIGILTAALVAALLVLGLSMRPRFVAEAIVDIGGVMRVDSGNLVTITTFEAAGEIEAFYANVLFAKAGGNSAGQCSAKAMYSPEGLRLRLVCRGQIEQQVREETLSSIRPLLDRHARPYEIAKALESQRKTSMERQLRAAEQAVEALMKYPASGVSEAEIIDLRIGIEDLRERLQLERLVGERVIPTRLEAQGVSVVDRTPGPRVWIGVVVLACLSGLFVTVFSAILERLEHEIPQHDA